jgi:hypothetical protein
MSRVYWHTKERTAELLGSERAWLSSIANGPAESAWDLDNTRGLERAAEILAMVPEVPDGQYGANYLHSYLREAQAQHERNMAVYGAWKPGTPMTGHTSHEEERRLVSALAVSLRVRGLKIHAAGAELETANLDLNTALVAGSDPVRLAAKIHGWCEIHCWIEGADRKWLAGIIDEGLAAGIYRRGMWYADQPDGPKDKWSSQGWDEVLDLLRERDNGPVVLSYSVGDGFPNADIADYLPPWPEGVPKTWDAYDALPEDVRQARDDAVEEAQERWYDLPDDERWGRAMAGLRNQRPWARIAPDTLAEVTFGPSVNVYDLFAPDRDDRIRRAFDTLTSAS